MTPTPSWNDIARYMPQRASDELLRLASQPILEPPWVDVGDAAIHWPKHEEER